MHTGEGAARGSPQHVGHHEQRGPLHGEGELQHVHQAPLRIIQDRHEVPLLLVASRPFPGHRNEYVSSRVFTGAAALDSSCFAHLCNLPSAARRRDLAHCKFVAPVLCVNEATGRYLRTGDRCPNDQAHGRFCPQHVHASAFMLEKLPELLLWQQKWQLEAQAAEAAKRAKDDARRAAIEAQAEGMIGSVVWQFCDLRQARPFWS